MATATAFDKRMIAVYIIDAINNSELSNGASRSCPSVCASTLRGGARSFPTKDGSRRGGARWRWKRWSGHTSRKFCGTPEAGSGAPEARRRSSACPSPP